MFLAATTPLVTNPITIFFIVLAIILVTPLVFNRLKIPHIIGMIVAGIAPMVLTFWTTTHRLPSSAR